MKVIVCGGRTYRDREHLFSWLDKFHAKNPITLLIEGGARGADRLAWEWAEERNIAWVEKKADWDLYGKFAGPIRNKAMLEVNPDAVIAFPGGTGTADMIRQAKAADVKIYDGSKDL